MKMTDKEYFARSEISNSDLKLINRSYAHYLNKDQQTDTPAMAFGRALHAFVLEEDVFWKDYVVAPPIDKRTTQGKLDWAQLVDSGKEIVSSDDWVELNQLKQNIMSHPKAKLILDGAKTEGVVFATLEGVACRGKIDVINGGFIIDLKTCQDASKNEFMRSIGNFAYHQQASFYLDLCKANQLPAHGFLFIAVERKAKNCGVATYVLDQESLDTGRAQYKRILKKYKEYVANTGKYAGYTPELEEIGVPQWVLTKEANDGFMV